MSEQISVVGQALPPIAASVTQATRDLSGRTANGTEERAHLKLTPRAVVEVRRDDKGAMSILLHEALTTSFMLQHFQVFKVEDARAYAAALTAFADTLEAGSSKAPANQS